MISNCFGIFKVRSKEIQFVRWEMPRPGPLQQPSGISEMNLNGTYMIHRKHKEEIMVWLAGRWTAGTQGVRREVATICFGGSDFSPSGFLFSAPGPEPAGGPRAEGALVPSADGLGGQYRRVPGQVPPAYVTPEHPFLVTRLTFERCPRGPPAVTGRHPGPDHRPGFVPDRVARLSQPERQVHVFEVGDESFVKSAHGVQSRPAVESRGGRSRLSPVSAMPAGGGSRNSCLDGNFRGSASRPTAH